MLCTRPMVNDVLRMSSRLGSSAWCSRRARSSETRVGARYGCVSESVQLQVDGATQVEIVQQRVVEHVQVELDWVSIAYH